MPSEEIVREAIERYTHDPSFYALVSHAAGLAGKQDSAMFVNVRNTVRLAASIALVLKERANQAQRQLPEMSEEFPLVVVQWEDATNVAEWHDTEEAQRFDQFEFDWECTNVGYLIRDDEECVIVASRATGDHKAVGLFERIPRGMVKSVKRLVVEQ